VSGPQIVHDVAWSEHRNELAFDAREEALAVDPLKTAGRECTKENRSASRLRTREAA
jgi:hypothetical protein